jgi:hypothetical protein
VNDVFAIYTVVWARAEEVGAWVHYGVAGDGEAGYFHPHDGERRGDGRPRKPEILIHRPYYKGPGHIPTEDSNAPPPLVQPDLVEELITLSHEYGHLMSWNGRTPRDQWERYDAVARRRSEIEGRSIDAMPTGLTVEEQANWRRARLWAEFDDADRRRVVLEEELAWEVGRELLGQLGFSGLDALDARARRGVHFHRYRLGMDELEPGDV